MLFRSGMDKLSWRRVKALINEVLIRRGIQCHVYYSVEPVLSSTEPLAINQDLASLQKKDDEIIALKAKVERNRAKGYVFENGVLLKTRKARNGRRSWRVKLEKI